MQVVLACSAKRILDFHHFFFPLEVKIRYMAIFIIIISLGSVLMYINAYLHIYSSFWEWELR